ncbi:MAG: sigma-70 family RNA polymerase sigma factor [Acetobacteraceae bacterium]|nr:sigma-70 family RNA polymerase sigma factor [Acetobacteraceae bacterium]
MDDGVFDSPEFLERLRRGEEAAYRRLVRRFHGMLVGVASGVIGSRAQAEEVVQDTWIAVFNNIGGFEGRSSLASWIYTIAINRARTRIGRERRTVALPSVLDGSQGEERAVPAAAFRDNGHWAEAPRLWDELDPERVVAGRQLWQHVQDAIELLPAGQRAVIILRDMEDRPGEEICALLQITPENQRVMLHRARARIRAAIDRVTAPTATAPAAAASPPGPRRGGGIATRLAAAGRALRAAWADAVACTRAWPA